MLAVFDSLLNVQAVSACVLHHTFINSVLYYLFGYTDVDIDICSENNVNVGLIK